MANVCMGTACFVRGSEKLQKEVESQLGIKTGQTTEDQLFSLDSVRCIGACGLAPVMTVDGKVHGRLETTADIKQALAKYRPEGTPEEAKGTNSNI